MSLDSGRLRPVHKSDGGRRISTGLRGSRGWNSAIERRSRVWARSLVFFPLSPFHLELWIPYRLLNKVTPAITNHWMFLHIYITSVKVTEIHNVLCLLITNLSNNYYNNMWVICNRQATPLAASSTTATQCSPTLRYQRGYKWPLENISPFLLASYRLPNCLTVRLDIYFGLSPNNSNSSNSSTTACIWLPW